MTILQFGDFELDLYARSLKRDGDTVRIGARAFDLLATLVLRAGEVLSKAQLMSAVWPETHVEESSLRVNIVALRKALDGGSEHRAIENVAGRGYTFTLPVEKLQGRRVPPSPKRIERSEVLPCRFSKLVGRDEVIERWSSDIRCGITTIVGQGGVGKTAVAIQIAKIIQGAFETVHFVDLADRSDDAPSQLAVALRSEAPTHTILPRAIESVIGRSVLIVLDGCEITIERAASIAEEIADRNPDAVLLATSREPLGIIGENVLHLSGLSVPGEGELITGVADFSGIELFAEKVSMVAGDIAIDTPARMEMAAEIVRKTDGNPLAIELAAYRLPDLGLENLMSSLDRPLRTLRRGNRTSHPRQQTLRASIDWSVDLLGDDERNLLASLSGLDGVFDRTVAISAAGWAQQSGSVHVAFDGLIMKSLIVADAAHGQYYLPRLIGEYAREKLQSGQFAPVGSPATEVKSTRSADLRMRPYHATAQSAPAAPGSIGSLVRAA